MWNPKGLSTGAAGLVVALACAGEPSGTDGRTSIVGQWNGDHVSLLLTGVDGSIEYDCAHGGLGSPLRPDAAGYFAVAGVHVRESGGPVLIGSVPDSLPAVYWGRLVGDVLTLRVVIGTDSVGPYTLRRNAPVRLWKCL